MIFAFRAKLRSVDRRRAILSGRKEGEQVVFREGPEQVFYVFDNYSLRVDPLTADLLKWKKGDVIEFEGRKVNEASDS